MSLNPRGADLIADLQGRLDAVADPGAKAWFENYLKHVVAYRGVKTPVVVRDASDHPLIEATIASLAGERERFIQTGIGRVVSDLAKSHPGVAAALVERHFDDLSAEVIGRHTRYLPDHEDYRKRKRKPRKRRQLP